MEDIRLHTITRAERGDIFDRTISSKGQTVADFFNNRTSYPTVAHPKITTDTTAEGLDTLTATELEAGALQWFPEGGDGDEPSDSELEEFDEIIGELQGTRLHPLANPVFQKMLDDGYSVDQARAALIIGPATGVSTDHDALIFGAAAVRMGMTLSRAKTNIMNGLGCSATQAEDYLTTDYGTTKFTLFQQLKEPMPDEPPARLEGDDLLTTDDLPSSMYRKYEAEVDEYQPATSSGLKANFRPGLPSRVPFPEPFDPGYRVGEGIEILQETNVQLVVRCEWNGKVLQSYDYYYVENYRPVADADLEFTGAFSDETLDICSVGSDGVCKATALPYSDSEGGEATLELGDSSQVNAAFKAIVELGDGINGYVRYHPDAFPDDKFIVMYFVPPTRVADCSNRYGTDWVGPGIGVTAGTHERSLMLDVLQGVDNEDLTPAEAMELKARLEEVIPWYNPPDEVREWLDPLLFDQSTLTMYSAQTINDMIKDAAANASTSGWPYGEYAPYSICDTENGKVMKVNLKFDMSKTSDPQNTGIFKCGDIPVAMNYTQEAPVHFLYENVDASNIPVEKMPKDVKGNTIPPNGEGVYLEASTCCGITSIIGGSTLTKHDDSLPNGQISVIEDSGQQDEMEEQVRITAGVLNDNGVDGPVGEYDLLFPASRVDGELPTYCADSSGVQGVDCTGYGKYANQSEVLAYAPDHPTYAKALRTQANPVDSAGNPFLNLNGPTDPDDPLFQKYIQGHRYEVTIAAWDNTAPLVMKAMPSRGIDTPFSCYPIKKLHYRLFRRENDIDATVFEGDAVPIQTWPDGCVDHPPSITLTWVPRADGKHFWEVDIEDTQGNARKLVSQVDVYPEGIDTRNLSSEGQRSGE